MFENLSGSQLNDRPSSVKTIGIGSPSYSDVRIGSSYPEAISRFERLRIYHLQLGEPQLVAQRVCDDAEGICRDLSVFRPI